MPSLDQINEEIIRFTENSAAIPLGTTSDEIYKKFAEAPYLPPEYQEEGMWYAANCKLDALFGVREGSLNFRKGPYGLDLVVKWLNKARKHEMWDSEADKAKKLIKPPGWDSASDQIVKIKMERILSHLKELSGEPPASESKGVKRRVVSTPDVDQDVSISQLVQPPAKRSQPLEIHVISSDDEEPAKEPKGSSTLKSKKNKPTQVESDSKRGYISSVSELLKMCPMSTPSKPCDRCKIEELIRRKDFWCHCGASKKTLHGGRTEAAQEHWKTATCIKKTAELRSTKVLTSFFTAVPADPATVPQDPIPAQPAQSAAL
ncbi:uncharacterized protein MELLADRAFT_109324 [Melampsora larici-populina 98AG31]|uniref:Uncharacterized protein n=1 Tax=Melampsora larici-populina (strain 98AG31 / pathotype 3-4-7) TaxID=747676 RepID=F4RW35_MELLP|nr:uncharacterized protein MELLADRAFT_109324 [Melampsora larici-populina 98AG31]EGG03477.1 hypothetical protein MELLADRAFT_109324 [Melampsora larici-populina 98AG31]